jgi:two-component system, NtrC family, sensor kinase
LSLSRDFMPHGFCQRWVPDLIWLHAISDSLIFLAYMTIPFTLIHIVRRRKDLPFNWILVCFGIFIVACGLTHAMEVWNLWHVDYWLAGAIKAITAAPSLLTAILLIQLAPKALSPMGAGQRRSRTGSSGTLQAGIRNLPQRSQLPGKPPLS